MNEALACILVQTLCMGFFTIFTLTGRVWPLANALALLAGLAVLMRLSHMTANSSFDPWNLALRVLCLLQALLTVVDAVSYFWLRHVMIQRGERP